MKCCLIAGRHVLTLLLVLLWSVSAQSVCAEHILVEGDNNYPPYEYLEDGVPKGFNIDIIRAVAKVSDLNVSINLRPWGEVLENLEKGASDVASGMYFSPGRTELFSFSIPHNIVSHSIFVREGSSIKKLEDLHGKEIIVQRGDIMHDYALEHYPNSTIIPVPSQEDALKMLSSGKYDAALLSKSVSLFRVSGLGMDNLEISGTDFAFVKYCFAVRKDNQELLNRLNEGLVLIKKSGEYDKIYEKWFGIYERRPIYEKIIHYAFLFFTLFAVLLLFSILWVGLLRHKVRQKTEELNAELLERHRAEKKLNEAQRYLASIINSMPSAIIGVDKERRINQWNIEAEKKYGRSRDSVLAKILEEAVPELSSQLDRVCNALQSGEQEVDPIVSRYVDKRTCYETVTIYPLTEAGMEGAVIRIDDITERINFEKMVMQSEKMLSIGGLAAGMAHEINNPLAVILGNVQNIIRQTSLELKINEDVARECGTCMEAISDYMDRRGIFRKIQSIFEAGVRSSDIVSNMLNFSRKSDTLKMYHDIPLLLDKTVDLISSSYSLNEKYDFKHIEIVRDYEKGVPGVWCESSEIQQVFLNLIRNGAEALQSKYQDVGLSRLILKVMRAGDMVRIEIEDNGPGMDGSVSKRIFEPFYTTKEVGKGTGLGLSISYFIVTEHHDGTMEVDSMPGEWTRFIIQLPIDKSKS
ncbi:transporter substrate-binding domain-containing protein [Maridesulfovibrio sp.]|uniref:transporter substrate-binding domain-containing protein n=1 Tax=Maridesulfovibrio sp. TaxID=2795000 RepID=UPI0029F45EC1|nr:transporter substrate-binding domain-containing protein [Maridesulfovibrio sp.]